MSVQVRRLFTKRERVDALVSVLALALNFSDSAGCELDSAQVTFVPPDSARVLLTAQCANGTTCWTRWVQVGDRRLGLSRACEVGHGSGHGGNAITVPPPAPAPVLP